MQQSSDPVRVAAELLARCEYGNVATVGVGGPWNTPVTCIADAALDLYWSSWSEAQHSRNIRGDPRVFITFYDSTRKRGTNRMGCLYLRANARMVLARDEGAKAHRLIYPDASLDLDGFFDEGPRRFYCATPEAAWLNDLSERQVTLDTRQMRMEIPLAGLRAAYSALAAE